MDSSFTEPKLEQTNLGELATSFSFFDLSLYVQHILIKWSSM